VEGTCGVSPPRSSKLVIVVHKERKGGGSPGFSLPWARLKGEEFRGLGWTSGGKFFLGGWAGVL